MTATKHKYVTVRVMTLYDLEKILRKHGVFDSNEIVRKIIPLDGGIEIETEIEEDFN